MPGLYHGLEPMLSCRPPLAIILMITLPSGDTWIRLNGVLTSEMDSLVNSPGKQRPEILEKPYMEVLETNHHHFEQNRLLLYFQNKSVFKIQDLIYMKTNNTLNKLILGRQFNARFNWYLINTVNSEFCVDIQYQLHLIIIIFFFYLKHKKEQFGSFIKQINFTYQSSLNFMSY